MMQHEVDLVLIKAVRGTVNIALDHFESTGADHQLIRELEVIDARLLGLLDLVEPLESATENRQ